MTLLEDRLSEEWTSGSNEAISLNLIKKDGTKRSFAPVFTYPIFGDQELLYGFKHPSINLKFDSSNLLPLIHFSFDEKLDSDAIEDPAEILKQFLPKDLYEDKRQWKKDRESAFKPPGDIIDVFEDSLGEEYAIYKVSLSNDNGLNLLLRIQIFVLFFIEAGSYIDSSDDKWEFYVVYKNFKTEAEFVGFSTVYPYLFYGGNHEYDDIQVTDGFKPTLRKRISQFVILPPFQGSGVGGKFYNSLMEVFLNDPSVKEITVEDPSEAFDDLRDRCDLYRLSLAGLWNENNGFSLSQISPEWLERERIRNKMAKRQFIRCVEMALLHYLNRNKKRDYKDYRLLVKQRLYLRNKEALEELDTQDISEKIEETYEKLEESYFNILSKVDFASAERGKKRAFDEKSATESIPPVLDSDSR